MPTYEYECTKGHRFEVVQRITEEPLKRCQQCRSRVQRLISASTFILKGDGWYADGYSSSSKASPASKESSSDSSSESKTTSSSTSKKDSKAGSKADSKSPSSSKSD